jgi:endonuclease/exonuclease/phosphatase (EEP) superfamily protein YafD
MRIVAWVLTAPVVLWALLRVGGLDRGYPLVPLVSFTPHVTAVSLPIVFALALMRQWRPFLVAAVAAAALLAVVLPRGFGLQTPPGGPKLRVLSANVLFGRVPPEDLVELVRERRVDILSVQELTPEFDAGLRRAGLTKLLPRDIVAPDAVATGTGIYSRLPLRELPEPPESVLNQVAVRTRWDPVGSFEVVAVHPLPPVSAPQTEQWERSLRALPPGDRPRMLVGDFNATLDHRELRRLIGTGYVDAADATGDGLKPTWPSGRSRPPITIDHVLASEHFAATRVEIIPLARGDHRAVFAELTVGSGAPD